MRLITNISNINLAPEVKMGVRATLPSWLSTEAVEATAFFNIYDVYDYYLSPKPSSIEAARKLEDLRRLVEKEGDLDLRISKKMLLAETGPDTSLVESVRMALLHALKEWVADAFERC